MINQASFANAGILFTTATAGIAAVNTIGMTVAGTAAVSGVGLPIAACIMATLLVVNQLYRIYNKNKELQSVMILIFLMCSRFENLIRLMEKMSTKYKINMEETLQPVSGIFKALLGRIFALAPRTIFDDIKNKVEKKLDINSGSDIQQEIKKGSVNIYNFEEFKERKETLESDITSPGKRFFNSLKRKMQRISSPDENYRVLIRDITVLGIWFSIIFSEFMLITGVSNNTVKLMLKLKDPELEKDSLKYIQAQLDYMNDITESNEYKILMNESKITQTDIQREIDLKVQKEKDVAIQTEIKKKLEAQALEAIQKIDKLVSTEKSKETETAIDQLIENNEAETNSLAESITTNYQQLTEAGKIEFVTEVIDPLTKMECGENISNNECKLQNLPTLMNWVAFLKFFKNIGNAEKVAEYELLLDNRS
jgi:hypothetical protein